MILFFWFTLFQLGCGKLFQVVSYAHLTGCYYYHYFFGTLLSDTMRCSKPIPCPSPRINPLSKESCSLLLENGI